MVELHCTPKLLKHVRPPPPKEAFSLPTRLGNWSATLLRADDIALVLAANEVSLLPVLFTAAPSAPFLPQMGRSVGEVLRALGIPQPLAFAELAAIQCAQLIKGYSLDHQAALNEFSRMTATFPEASLSPLKVSLHLANTSIGALGTSCPATVTRSLFAGARRHLRLVS